MMRISYRCLAIEAIFPSKTVKSVSFCKGERDAAAMGSKTCIRNRAPQIRLKTRGLPLKLPSYEGQFSTSEVLKLAL